MARLTKDSLRDGLLTTACGLEETRVDVFEAGWWLSASRTPCWFAHLDWELGRMSLYNNKLIIIIFFTLTSVYTAWCMKLRPVEWR